MRVFLSYAKMLSDFNISVSKYAQSMLSWNIYKSIGIFAEVCRVFKFILKLEQIRNFKNEIPLLLCIVDHFNLRLFFVADNQEA